MKFFVDTAEVADIAALNEAGLIDGVTTNPSLVKKTGRDFKEILREICAVTKGDVSAEVTALDAAGMVAQGEKLAALAKNIVVKLPLTADGLRACRTLTDKKIRTNVTLCFSANQGLLAAKAGASYVSPFIGRLDDIHADGMELIHELRQIYDNYGFATQILAASIRTPLHVKDAALAGADVATVPPNVLWGLLNHPLTEKGLAQFTKDAKESGLDI